jgi:hypothetical protein
MSYDPDTWMNSRFTVCRVGYGFSVEDKKTGERVGYYRSASAAVKARQAASDALKEKHQ